jgi:hypothetical protein
MTSTAAARVVQPIGAADVAARTGMSLAELDSVSATVRGLYRWTPSLSAESAPGRAGLTAVEANWPERNVSGVLFVNAGATSAFLVHDLPANAGARDVNGYLSHVLTTSPAVRDGMSLAERSVADPSESFCNVIRTNPEQSQLPAQSERTMSAGDVAERVGIEEADVLRVIDSLRTPSELPGCFAHARPLGLPVEVAGQPVERIVA